MGKLLPKRRHGILLCLAEMCSELEECRSRLLSLQVSDVLSDALRHESDGVRCTACICLRNSARSIKNLTAGHLTYKNIMLPLVQLLHDPSIYVQISALVAISNIVMDFSTLRSTFIEYGGIKQLIELSKSRDSRIRFSALLALRNLMYLADEKHKQLVFSDLKAPAFACLISDPDPSVQEQALALLRNLVDGCISSIELVFDEDGLILDTVGRQMRTASYLEIVEQGMYVLSNVASGTELQKDAVMHQIVPQGCPNFVLKVVKSNNEELLNAMTWMIMNTVSPLNPCGWARYMRLCDVGIISQLMKLTTDPRLLPKGTQVTRVGTVLGYSMSFGES